MTSLTAALAQSRRTISGKQAKPFGRIILQPTEFTDKTVKGTVLTGAAKGQEIEVELKGHLKAKDYTTKSKKSYVDMEKGGTLRIEGVKEGNDGVYASKWIRSFNGKPSDIDRNVVDAVVKHVTTENRDTEDRPVMRMNQLMMDNVSHATTMEEFEAALLDSLTQERAVTLYAMDGGVVSESVYTLGGEKKDGTFTFNDPAERVATIMASLEDIKEVIEATLAGSGFSVVPTRSYMVGADTAANIEIAIQEADEKGTRPSISTIDPATFLVPTMGQRMSFAVNAKGDNAMAEGTADKLKAAFKAFADEADLEAFMDEGWSGVSNDTMTKFLETNGVTVAKHPTKGWSTQCMLEKRIYEDMENGFIVKSFPLTGAAPYPAVEACKDARAAFYSEMKEAAEAVVEGLRAGVQADKAETKAEAKAEKAEAEAEVKDTADDLDQLMAGIGEDMDIS